MKKSLSRAIALATLVGAAASAQAAIEVNENGLGGALLYPMYTVENGNSTLVSVTNTTDEYKAVKIRFLEGMNSVEVLDFHLYLSPKDVWSGSIVATENGAKLLANDTSCIAGYKAGVGFPAEGLEFRDFEIVADSVSTLTSLKAVGANDTINRSRVGHFEVIEMGNIDPAYLVNKDGTAVGTGIATDVTLGKAIKHVNGTPGNCGVLTAMWENGGLWETEAATFGAANTVAGKQGSAVQGFKKSAAAGAVGGLYGTAAVVNVAGGWAASYDAVALEDTTAKAGIYATVQHPRPGSVYPSLATDGVNSAGAATGALLNNIRTAISAKNIFNDYYIDPALNAETDLVVSYPTKRFYVNGTDVKTGTDYIRDLAPVSGAYSAIAANENPFSNGWNLTKNQSCDVIKVSYFDKEEKNNTIKPADIGLISPLPPAQVAKTFDLCYETNILSIGNNSNVFGGELVRKVFPLEVGFTEGWMDIDLTTNKTTAAAASGLPVIGFSTILTKNGNAGGAGVLANFAQTFKHKVK